jgi:hypothetical protein
MTRRWWTVLFGLATACGTARPALPTATAARAVLDHAVASGEVAGVVGLVAEHGRIVFLEGSLPAVAAIRAAAHARHLLPRATRDARPAACRVRARPRWHAVIYRQRGEEEPPWALVKIRSDVALNLEPHYFGDSQAGFLLSHEEPERRTSMRVQSKLGEPNVRVDNDDHRSLRPLDDVQHPCGRSPSASYTLALSRYCHRQLDAPWRAVRGRSRSNEDAVCYQAFHPLCYLLLVHLKVPAYLVHTHRALQQLKEKCSRLREEFVA